MILLQLLGITTIGFGAGICGDVAGDYDAWNVSISVRDFREADAAIEAVDAELRRWGVGHFSGVSVRGLECIVAL